jgi:hypothetical protein
LKSARVVASHLKTEIITKFLTNNKVSKYTIRLKALEEEIKYIENTISDLSKKIIG